MSHHGPLAAGVESPKARRACPIVVLALLASLAASLALDGYLVRLGHRYQQATEAIRLDPSGLKVYASERSKSASDSPVLVFFGDSRAAMWPAPDGPAGYRVVNRGVGYQTTAQILLRLDDDVARLRPAVVVLEGGVNDLKAIADFPDRRREIVADCEANLRQIVARCRETGAKVVLVSIFGIGDLSLWRRPFWSKEVSAAVGEVNAFLPTLAGPQVVVFDANLVLTDGSGGIQHAYQLDHLHLTSTGYAALNRSLVPLIRALSR
jgi:lysophospholipase L1-like esterase